MSTVKHRTSRIWQARKHGHKHEHTVASPVGVKLPDDGWYARFFQVGIYLERRTKVKDISKLPEKIFRIFDFPEE